MTHKLIYLAKRNPSVAEKDFGETWKSHSLLASSLGTNFSRHFTRVRQCIKVYDAKVPAEYVNEHDGAALLTMKSWEDLRAARSHPNALSTMRDDELRVFAEHAANFTMATEEIAHEGRGEGVAALLHFVRSAPGTERSEFESRWRPQMVAMFDSDRAHQACGQVLSRTIETPGPRYDFAGVSETWFPSVELATEAAWKPARREAMRQLESVIHAGGSVVLLVRINFEKIPAPAG
jgi:hypothetical protein